MLPASKPWEKNDGMFVLKGAKGYGGACIKQAISDRLVMLHRSWLVVGTRERVSRRVKQVVHDETSRRQR